MYLSIAKFWSCKPFNDNEARLKFSYCFVIIKWFKLGRFYISLCLKHSRFLSLFERFWLLVLYSEKLRNWSFHESETYLHAIAYTRTWAVFFVYKRIFPGFRYSKFAIWLCLMEQSLKISLLYIVLIIEQR